MSQNRGKRTDFAAFAIYDAENCTLRGILSEFSLLGSIWMVLCLFSMPASVRAESPVRMVANNASALKRGFAWESNRGK